jgi:ABC-type glycerol-3-phosphate transport system substrate-binding protein
MKGNFQIILIIVFVLAALFGVLVFSGAIDIGGGSTEEGQGEVVLWGTYPSATMGTLVEVFNTQNPTFLLKYVQRSEDTYDEDLLEAFASGEGPDLFFITDKLAYKYSNKIFITPPESYPISAFKSNFVGAAEVFLNNEGMIAFPMVVDPLMMYFNRSMMDASGIVFPPSDWEEFTNQSIILTKKDDANRISKSGAALGHFSNVTHAKDILTTLFMQGGNPIVVSNGGQMVSTLGEINTPYTMESILQFYTNFANPTSEVYSWNKSLSESSEAFSSEDLAFYFGYASELMPLVNTNPNQNFLAASIPQIKGSDTKVTGAKVTGIAVSSFSKNFNTALIAAGTLSSSDFPRGLAERLGVTPARRDLLNNPPNDSFSPAFYTSALYAKSWLDPDPKGSDNVFRGLVEGVLSNNRTLGEAIADAGVRLSILFAR